MLSMRIALGSAALAAIVASTGAVRAEENAATGVWIDHTGRGAVEITDCAGKLCGHVAWVKDEANKDQCGKQIIGNVKSVGTNKWDNGWIYDPDRDTKYDVAISTIGADKPKVTGYAGTKWLSETYTWKRAPADLQKCNSTAAATPASPQTTGESDAKKSDTDKADAPKSEPAKAPEPAKEETAKTVPEPTPRVDAKPADAAKATESKPDAPKSESAKTDEPKAEEPKNDAAKTNDGKKDSAKKDDSSEESTAGNDATEEDAGKIVSRIIESLDDEGDSSDGGPKKKKGTCKFNVPYADIVVSVPCDK